MPTEKRHASDLDPVRRSFDAIADAYARSFVDELDRKPFDRRLLEAFATEVGAGRPVLDLGTGAGGQVGRLLHDRGLDVTGVDFSAASLALARRLNPGMEFVEADIRALPMADRSVVGIVAFYSLIYGTDQDVVTALGECRRVLEPGGRILIAVHGGRPGDQHFDDFQGIPIDVTMRHTTPAALRSLAESAGLAVDEIVSRNPYDFEHETQRIYLRGHA